MWEIIEDYYEKDPEADKADTDIIKERLRKRDSKHLESLEQFVTTNDLSSATVLQVAQEVQLERIRSDIAHAAQWDEDKLEGLFEEFSEVKENTQERTNLGITDLEGLLTDQGRKIQVLPSVLNKQLKGGVKRKDHIMIFGLGEIGKSLFILNMAYGFVKQGYRVGFLDNEDNPEDVLKRYVTRGAGTTLDEFESDPGSAIEKALLLRGELVFKELAPGTPREITKWVKDNKPDVVIVNQISNLSFPRAQSPEQQRREASSFMRNLGKTYNIIPVSVIQASIDAEDKMYLTTKHMDYSKVGCATQTELLLGIGGSIEMINGGERMISVIRNKISGTHIPFRCYFHTDRVKVE